MLNGAGSYLWHENISGQVIAGQSYKVTNLFILPGVLRGQTVLVQSEIYDNQAGIYHSCAGLAFGVAAYVK